MEELDLLKQHWKKEDNFKKISSQNISKMIHRNSSSTVKWIFIVSVMEFLLGIILSVYFSFFANYESNPDLDMVMEKSEYLMLFFSVVFYIVILYFIFRFYEMYKRIRITDNVKALTENIINTRKIVKRYILFNLIMIFVNSCAGGFASLYYSENTGFDIVNWGKSFFIILFILAFAATFCLILWGVYRLIYGWFLRKLERNYKELKKMDIRES